MKKNKSSKVDLLNAEINILTGLIQNLLHLCSANKVRVPDHILEIISTLYNVKQKEKENGEVIN